MKNKKIIFTFLSLALLVISLTTLDSSASQSRAEISQEQSLICSTANELDNKQTLQIEKKKKKKSKCQEQICSDASLQKWCMCNQSASQQYKCGCKRAAPSSNGASNMRTQSSTGN